MSISSDISFVRRVGDDPKAPSRYGGPIRSSGDKSCPDVWQLSDGSFAVIGYRAPAGLVSHAPDDFRFDDRSESVVIVPRDVLRAAAEDVLA